MKNACVSPKCNFRIAIWQFCINQYPSFIYTKTQPYIFPFVRLCFFFLQDTRIEKPDEFMVSVLKFRTPMFLTKMACANSADPDQNASEREFDQALHCLLFHQVICEKKFNVNCSEFLDIYHMLHRDKKDIL